MSESTPGLDQTLTNGSSVGIMQVNTTAHPEYNPTLLRTDPVYNINAGATILCQEIKSQPNLLEALAAYKGFALQGGYSDPLAKTEVDTVIKWAS